MAIILGATTLNPNMIWVERYGYSKVIQEVQVTLDGSPVVYTRTWQAGMPITLVATDEQGWLTKDMADAVQTSAQTPGAIYTLTIGAETFSVIFRHHEAPAVALRPLLLRAVPLPEDYFVGELKLMTVA
jgi:hypothetical protein